MGKTHELEVEVPKGETDKRASLTDGLNTQLMLNGIRIDTGTWHVTLTRKSRFISPDSEFGNNKQKASNPDKANATSCQSKR